MGGAPPRIQHALMNVNRPQIASGVVLALAILVFTGKYGQLTRLRSHGHRAGRDQPTAASTPWLNLRMDPNLLLTGQRVS